jgi:hypothetical protein
MYGAEGMITVPSTVAVIEHATHGLILFDTGVNHHVADPEAAEAYWGPVCGRPTAPRGSPGSTPSTRSWDASATARQTSGTSSTPTCTWTTPAG